MYWRRYSRASELLRDEEPNELCRRRPLLFPHQKSHLESAGSPRRSDWSNRIFFFFFFLQTIPTADNRFRSVPRRYSVDPSKSFRLFFLCLVGKVFKWAAIQPASNVSPRDGAVKIKSISYTADGLPGKKKIQVSGEPFGLALYPSIYC